jgi:hypothetical protein
MIDNNFKELEKTLKQQISKLEKLKKTKPDYVSQYYEIKEIMDNHILDIESKIILIKILFGGKK